MNLFLVPNEPISDEMWYKVLNKSFTPLPDYDFKKDVLNDNFKRAFCLSYSPYSSLSSLARLVYYFPLKFIEVEHYGRFRITSMGCFLHIIIISPWMCLCYIISCLCYIISELKKKISVKTSFTSSSENTPLCITNKQK